MIPSKLKIIFVIVAGFAVTFVLCGGLTIGYSPISVVFLACIGALFGAIAAPEIEPKLFRYPALWQVGFSVFGCVLIAAFLRVGVEGYAMAILIGALLGYLGPYWIKYVRAP